MQLEDDNIPSQSDPKHLGYQQTLCNSNWFLLLYILLVPFWRHAANMQLPQSILSKNWNWIQNRNHEQCQELSNLIEMLLQFLICKVDTELLKTIQ